MKVIELYNFNTEAKLQEARTYTEEEKSHVLPKYADMMLCGVGMSVELPRVGQRDIPDEWFKTRKQWSFPGCCNTAFEVTDEEWNSFIALSNQRVAEEKANKYARKIRELRGIIEQAEQQKSIPTREERETMLKAWLNAENEGGEGYMPRIVSREYYEWAKCELERLTSEVEQHEGH